MVKIRCRMKLIDREIVIFLQINGINKAVDD